VVKVQEMRRKLEQAKGQKLQVESEINRNSKALKEQKTNLLQYEKAREIIKEVGLKTQEQLQFHISDITSLALESVFPEPYKLELEFIQRRNKTECDIYFSRYGQKVDPLSASGGGAVDIASFALRIASWSLQSSDFNNTIILDEPMRFVSEDYQDKAANMIKEVSRKLGIQFIIITHNPTLAAYADKTFEIRIQKKGESKGISRVVEV